MKKNRKFLRKKTPILAWSILSVSVTIFLVSCGIGRDRSGPQNMEELRELVYTKGFEVENQWALPMGGSQIDLIGNPNFIRFKGDSVDLFLPYFGRRFSGGAYNREGGIRYEGPARELEIEENERSNSIVLRFQGRQEGENLQFNLTLYSNGTANTSVNSTQRSAISYRGQVQPLPETETR